jgi:DNA excision repair protein ERCC-2
VAAKPIISIAVRELVEFVCRSGDLGGERDFVSPDRARAGTLGHQRVQSARPAGYQKEVRISCDVDAAEFILRIHGRIDGLLACGADVLVEEIKTVDPRWNGRPDPLHWAQVKVYGSIVASERGLRQVQLRLTYLDLESGRLTEFVEQALCSDLTEFFGATTSAYLDWVREYRNWSRQRDKSIQALSFPYKNYRQGQRELAVAAYRAITKEQRLFVEAPTGIGKTISVLFPAVKALGEGHVERIFYLTARNTGRVIAESALDDLRRAQARVRSLTITAKEKVCVREGQPCDLKTCPLARGYYDRNKAAMRATLAREEINFAVLQAAAQDHQVCPFELSLDVSTWVDVVICDYNYAFDPRVYLRRHFSEANSDGVFLVDEGHNLIDRARDMFSAEIDTFETRQVRRAVKEALPRCARALSKLSSGLLQLWNPGNSDGTHVEASEDEAELNLFSTVAKPELSAPGAAQAQEALLVGHEGVTSLQQLPPELPSLIDNVLKQAEAWLIRDEPADFRDSLRELYFRLQAFRRVTESYDEHYVTLVTRTASETRVKLFCLNPSSLLNKALARGKAAVIFSATLAPMEYYRDLLGGRSDDPILQLGSPFPREHLGVLVHDRIRTHFKARGETLDAVVEAIGVAVKQRPGNYLVFFPSYQYLAAVQAQFQKCYPEVPVLTQQPGMSDAERAAFLEAFCVERSEPLAGFAVLGGVFGEGIDLAGDRLVGAIVIGVGLPQLTAERDLIRLYFDQRLGAGFAYAYLFPGMNRVLQASGRVIRSETDRGIVLLIDTRFAEARYRRLFPAWWQMARVRNVQQMHEVLDQFWKVND